MHRLAFCSPNDKVTQTNVALYGFVPDKQSSARLLPRNFLSMRWIHFTLMLDRKSQNFNWVAWFFFYFCTEWNICWPKWRTECHWTIPWFTWTEKSAHQLPISETFLPKEKKTKHFLVGLNMREFGATLSKKVAYQCLSVARSSGVKDLIWSDDPSRWHLLLQRTGQVSRITEYITDEPIWDYFTGCREKEPRRWCEISDLDAAFEKGAKSFWAPVSQARRPLFCPPWPAIT